MARILSGSILTGASGRIGDLVTYNLRGTQVVRTLPETSKKRKRSPLQQQHISSFKTQHATARSVKKTIIDRIWSHLSFSGGANPYNQFIKRNRAAYGGTDHIKFPELMVISDGNLLPASEFTVQWEESMLKLSWGIGETGKYSALTDRLNIVILTFRSSLTMMDTEVRRAQKNADINFSSGSAGPVEGFVFWSSENDEHFSPSLYWICR